MRDRETFHLLEEKMEAQRERAQGQGQWASLFRAASDAAEEMAKEPSPYTHAQPVCTHKARERKSRGNERCRKMSYCHYHCYYGRILLVGDAWGMAWSGLPGTGMKASPLQKRRRRLELEQNGACSACQTAEVRGRRHAPKPATQLHAKTEMKEKCMWLELPLTHHYHSCHKETKYTY